MAIIITSCGEDPPPPPEPPTTNAVLISNSGLATEGTGTLSAYDPLQKSVEHNVFYKANIYPLGNTLFSVMVDADLTFLVMGGTGEVLIVNSNTYEMVERVEGFGAPRFVQKVAENKYYISDWQEDGVWKMRVNADNKVRMFEPIPTGVAPEKMIMWEDMVFVVNSGSVFTDSTITVIDAMEDTVMANIVVGENPNSLQIDPSGKLWVLCGGIEDEQNPLASTNAQLVSFDLMHDSLRTYIARDSLVGVDTLLFDDNQIRPTQLTINAAGDILYFLDNDEQANLMRFDMEIGLLPNVPFIEGSFNGIGYDELSEEIYLSDVLNRQVDGEVHRYDEDGQQIDFFKVGLIPESFGFK